VEASGASRDTQQASREAGLYAYSRVASSAIAFVGLMVGARLYAKPELAFVSAIVLLYESGMALGSLGLADAVFYFIGRNPAGAREVVRQTSLLLLVVAVPVIAAVWLAGWHMSNPQIDVTAALPWLAVILLFELPTQPAVNQLIASGHARLGSALFLLFACLRVAAFLTPGIAGIAITWVPVAMAAGSVVRLAAHVTILRRWFPSSDRAWLRAARLREVLWFALPAGAGLIAGQLNPQIDKYAVQLWLDANALANYGIAAYELPLVTLVPYAIGAVMQSRYVRRYIDDDIDGLRDLWFSTVRKTMLIVLPLTMVLIALGRDAVMLIGGAKFADAATPFRLFTLVLLHRVASYGAMLQSIGQTRAIIVSSALLIVGNAALTYPLTMLLGYPGPALASVIAMVPPWLFTLGRIGSVLGGGIRGALPWGFYARVLALSGALGAAVWLGAQQLDLPPAVRLIGGAAVLLGGFAVLGRLLGLIERADLRYLRGWLSLRMLR